MIKAPPEQLRTARRELEKLAQLRIDRDLCWHPKAGVWILECALCLPELSTPALRETHWCVLISDEYPFGSVRFFPHETSSLTETYPHQDLNLPAESGTNWRRGRLCLDQSNKSLHRQGVGLEDEPYTIEERLLWQASRAVRWISLADENKLLDLGDPFELPPFPDKSDLSIGFCEDQNSMFEWAKCEEKSGSVLFAQLGDDIAVATRFLGRRGNILRAVGFGKKIVSASQRQSTSLWVALTSPPILPPWRPPLTWGELRSSLKEQGIDLDSILSARIDSLRGKGHLLLLGAPIPRTVGAAPSQIHWWAVELPALAKRVNGFRNSGVPYWKCYRNSELSDSKELCWVETANWSPSEISARGVFNDGMRSKTVTIIGAGALGSLVSEALVRGGVNKLVLVDNDALEIGNLTRHSLDLNYLGKPKSKALALRLNTLSPFADTEGIAADIRRLNDEQYAKVLSSEVILDCTGNSDVLEFFERKELNLPKLYVSVSLSAHAADLYYFASHGTTFPFSRFRELIAPLIIDDRRTHSEEEFPRDGVGCWHSVFPARYDQVIASIPIICQMLEDTISSESKVELFKVIPTSGEAK